MNKKDIIQFFNTLPNYNSQEFSLKITQEILTSSTDVETLVNLLKEILDEYKNRDNSIINNKKLAFAACYALIVLYRRYDEQFKIKKLTDDFNSLFEDIPLFISEKSRICVEIGNNNDLKKALKLGKKSIELLEGKEHAGIFNNYSEIIYAFLTIFLYLLKCPQSLILSALRAFCFCGKPHISRSIFLYFRYQTWLKSW